MTDEYTQALEETLYACVKELDYMQSVENCGSGLCATAAGKELIETAMTTLGVVDLSEETWREVLKEGKAHTYGLLPRSGATEAGE